jgi:acyl-CoA thioesterase FadM
VADWLETYRGVVNPWECDVVQHFTIGYYFDRFATATRNFLDLAGVGDGFDADIRHGTSRGYATFVHELRAGAGFHILTAVTSVDTGVLHLGHQVLDSTTGKPVTWLMEKCALPQDVLAATRQKLASLVVPWPGPQTPDRPVPRPAPGLLTARDRVKPWEIGEDATLSLHAHILRFSAASMQMQAAVGMTAAYMHQQRRGYSTFELDLTRIGEAMVGDIIDVTTSVAHLGNSSLRFMHRMTGPSGRELAYLTQSGVHLDMDARRSTPIPEELRAGIRAHLTSEA